MKSIYSTKTGFTSAKGTVIRQYAIWETIQEHEYYSERKYHGCIFATSAEKKEGENTVRFYIDTEIIAYVGDAVLDEGYMSEGRKKKLTEEGHDN